MVSVFHPDPRLRKRAVELNDPVEEVRIIERLIAEGDENLIGLATVQIDEPGRIIIYRDFSLDDIWSVLVDPVIVNRSEEHSIEIEGCGSIPDIFVAIKRPIWITVRHSRGEFTVQGRDARVIMHEIDHLNGILIIDYTNYLA